jgi:hypothetical protein
MTKKLFIIMACLFGILCIPCYSNATDNVYAISQTWFKGDFSTDNVAQYYLSSVNASTTADIVAIGISDTFRGYIVRVEASCQSTDYDLKILQRDSVTALDTVDEIYSYTAISKDLNDPVYPPQPFVNNNYTSSTFDPSENPYLYVYRKNDDAVNATGRFNLKITYRGRK